MTNTTTRRAWLTLPNQSLVLDNPDGGWVCTELDLGWPDVRAVTDPDPQSHGLIDRTQYFGGRTVTAKIDAYQGGSFGGIDAIVEQFAPFMDPGARPQLHYLTDGNTVERVISLRAAQFGGPMIVPPDRPFQLAWVAPDPIAMGAATLQTTAWSGATSGGGRTYNMVHPRTYPAGSGSASNGWFATNGDMPVMPYLRIYGPITGGRVTFYTNGPPQVVYVVALLSTYRIDPPHFLGIDTKAHVAFLDDDPKQPALDALDWTQVVWPVLPVAPDWAAMTLTGQNTSGSTQVQATWQDRYLL